MSIKNILLLILTLFIFQACSSKPKNVNYTYNSDKRFPQKDIYNYDVSQSYDYETLYNELLEQYKEWKGVRYKYGGNSKRGIDCSAFVQNTFRDKLKLKIPRTTKLQSAIGEDISMNQVEIGDLIFFKTGYKTRHVGIYLGEGKFLHASTKRGVTISRLDNPYYAKHFWKIKRVIN